MSKKTMYILWGVFFLLCAALGFVPEPEGVARNVLTVLSVLFFLPPAAIVYAAGKEGAVFDLKLVRNLSAASLAATAAVLSVNFLAAPGPQWLGDGLYYLLIVISSPMICCGYWALSLFLWACLLVASQGKLRKGKK